MTPSVRGETLTFRQNEQEQELTVGTPAWFAWLKTASTFSFASEEGLFTARQERASRQRWMHSHNLPASVTSFPTW